MKITDTEESDDIEETVEPVSFDVAMTDCFNDYDAVFRALADQ